MTSRPKGRLVAYTAEMKSHDCPLCGHRLNRRSKLDWQEALRSMPGPDRRRLIQTMTDREQQRGRWLRVTRDSSLFAAPGTQIIEVQDSGEDE